MPDSTALRDDDPRDIGDYRLRGRLGEGGQGTVYLAEDSSGSLVAVKTLKAASMSDPVARRRFAGEVALVRQVSSFCVAEVLDADLDGDRPYIVSEYVEGLSLQTAIVTEGAYSRGVLRRLAVGTVTALAAIHGAGIVHRDLKPHNVLLGRDGPRVIDFGIARLLDATTTAAGPIGSVAYMSPEQISGEPIGPASDMFSWASTLVYAASGRPPFGADTIPAVMHRILHGEPNLPGLPADLRDVLADCFAKDSQHRPTAQDVLLRLIGGGNTTDGAGTVRILTAPTAGMDRAFPLLTATDPPSRPRVWRRKAWILAASALALTASAAAAAVLLRSGGGGGHEVTATGTLLYGDGFSDRNGWDGWTFAPDAPGDNRSPKGYQIERGVYSIRADKSVPQNPALSPVPQPAAPIERDVMIGVTAQLQPGGRGSGEFGLLCRWDENRPHGYSFVVNLDGTAHIFKNTPGARADLAPPVPAKQPQVGRDIRIQAACRQSASGAPTRLILWLDGKQLIDTTDAQSLPDSEKSEVGLIAKVPEAGSNLITVSFDDFTLHRSQ